MKTRRGPRQRPCLPAPDASPPIQRGQHQPAIAGNLNAIETNRQPHRKASGRSDGELRRGQPHCLVRSSQRARMHSRQGWAVEPSACGDEGAL